MNKTNIEYLTHTWNPIAMRCTPISEGCANCWHIKMADRMKNNPKLPIGRRDSYSGGPPVLIERELNEPLRLKKSSIIGVEFMGDIFADSIHRDWILRILMVIRKCPQHTFIILTKRAKRMYDFCRYWFSEAEALADMTLQVKPIPKNLWLGVSVESDKYRWRIEELMKIPAAKRFIFYEPALGPLDVKLYLGEERHGDCGGCKSTPVRGQPYCPEEHELGGIDGVIAGCESGSNRRPAKIEWFRDSKNQCVEAKVPFFLKQMDESMDPKASIIKMPFLDGQIWNELPF